MTFANFGIEAQALKLINDVGVPDGIREVLRQRYAVCQKQNYLNKVQLLAHKVFYQSVNSVPADICMFGCRLCVAVYDYDSGVISPHRCEYCQMDPVSIR